MGLFSKPKFPKRSAMEEPLFREGQAMQAEARGFAPGIRAFISDISDTSDERTRAGRAANANAWQAEAATREYDSTRPGISAFARAMGAGKARSRIVTAGEEAVEMQALRDRAAVSSAGNALRSGNVQDMARLAGGQNELIAANMQASQIRNAGVAGLVGTMAGYGIGAGIRGVQNHNAMKGLSPDIPITAKYMPRDTSSPALYQV
jgi:hypothetical protein